MNIIPYRLRRIFTRKVTPREILTNEMRDELRRLRVNEDRQAEQIRKLKQDLELANNRHKIFAEHLKAHYIRVFKQKLLEIRNEKVQPQKAA
ncbi:hypothetical protein [Pseudomonas putida]|uniref:Uncharacterized protein n=1 Tax=Pseudomonas putida TaxID=303 RepID=A0A8I1EC61_PSEPU|nr:hypothetical protein [Pseudomonas putida]MBI6882821.1 hypothetical protein [Pseudomonas putida]